LSSDKHLCIVTTPKRYHVMLGPVLLLLSITAAPAPSVETMSSKPDAPQKGARQPLEPISCGNHVAKVATMANSDPTSHSGTPSTANLEARSLGVARASGDSPTNTSRGQKPRADESKVNLDFKLLDLIKPRAPEQCTRHSDAWGSQAIKPNMGMITHTAHHVHKDKNLFDKINLSYNDVPIQGPSICIELSILPTEGHASQTSLESEPLRSETPLCCVTTSVTSKSSAADMGVNPNPLHNQCDTQKPVPHLVARSSGQHPRCRPPPWLYQQPPRRPLSHSQGHPHDAPTLRPTSLTVTVRAGWIPPPSNTQDSRASHSVAGSPCSQWPRCHNIM
jgi:hypothetical protein